MKKGIVLFAGVMVFVMLFAGFSDDIVQAGTLWTPQDDCEDALRTPGYSFMSGSRFVPAKQQCILGWTNQSLGIKNQCYPKLDVWQALWEDINFDTIGDGKISNYWVWKFVGCTELGNLIKDPNQGSANLGDGISFSYEQGTCTNGCNVSKFGLTGAAKQALGALDGTVKGKSYVQIKDDDGALVSGNFTLCFNAKSLDNPYFFRWAGGNSWSPMGGYWNGNSFCMAGTISGNYVMVDLP